MNEKVKSNFNEYIEEAKVLIEIGKLDDAFCALEIAHIIGQRSIIPHTISHVYMLKIGIIKRDISEVAGQLFRIPTGIIGSALGLVPTGNTGGSNVSPLRTAEIPDEIRELME